MTNTDRKTDRRAVKRRTILAGAAWGIPAAAAVTAVTAGVATGVNAGRSETAPLPDIEDRSLEQLYAAARREGRGLTVYAGGDTPVQQDGTLEAFTRAFPEVELRMIVDYSKYHDVRIDRQLDEGDLVPDVTHLQTSHDFTRWKALGALQQYRPAGWDQVHELLKDPEGYWVAGNVLAFSFVHGPSGGPASPRHLADPEWADGIVTSHPGDDDATLFLYRAYVREFGWEWLRSFAANRPVFRRGTNTPGEAVDAGIARVGVGTAGTGSSTQTWVQPANEPFLAWGQRAAILAQASNPDAAKLYLNWLVSPEVQAQGWHGWGVRTDVVSTTPAWDLPNANMAAFHAFMEDRAEVERWRQTMILELGEVTGEPTPGWLGLRPTHHA